MVELAFGCTSGGSTVEEIPKTACAAVITPVWNRRHVSQDRVQRDLRLVRVAEVFRDSVNLFLARRIPSHFAAEGHRAPAPVFGMRFQLSFQSVGLILPALTL